MNMSDVRNFQTFVDSLAHCRALGIVVESVGDGSATMRMPWKPELIGDPRTSVIHGGAVSALLDTCAGAAVLTHPKNNAPTATISLRIDYMRSATPGQTVLAKADVYHVTKSVAFVRAWAGDDEEQPVASATGTFTLTQSHPGSRAWYEGFAQQLDTAKATDEPSNRSENSGNRSNPAGGLAGADHHDVFEPIGSLPYAQFMGIKFARHGDELTAVMSPSPRLIGNPTIPALHGGAIAGFLETVATAELVSRSQSMANGASGIGTLTGKPAHINFTDIKKLPKTIDFAVDFMRPGLDRVSHARAHINRFGSRFVSVRVEAWQEQRDRHFAEATGHFLNPFADA